MRCCSKLQHEVAVKWRPEGQEALVVKPRSYSILSNFGSTCTRVNRLDAVSGNATPVQQMERRRRDCIMWRSME